ncbi:MAG TPA: O-antigen ligase family protein [Thermoanaerobaculia bacterium]|nr:O-antigen ligase family protein [Thermoanaerobaculia bacterium]
MRERGPERAIVIVLAAGLLITATIITNGNDHFRLPKELAFRAEAIALLALGVFWGTSKRRTWTLERHPELVLTAAVLLWTIITTAASTNRLISIDSLITVIAAAVIFIATTLAAQTATFPAIDVVMIGACINAIVVILQELKIWTPYQAAPDVRTHMGSVALLGNPNDVGTYLAAPALAAVAMAVVARGKRRWIYTAVSVLLIAGMVASATRTAIIALLFALVVFAVTSSRRIAIAVIAMLIVLGLLMSTSATFLGRSTRKLVAAAANRNYEQLFSERLVPFLTALEMWRDHPIAGVGPGCFRYHFMSYRLALNGRYPAEWIRGYPMNWGEVHNDHLQVAAESGLPGYALFLAAIAIVAGRRKRAMPQTPRAQFARAFRWPFAALVLMIAMGQFPLELAAPRLMLLTLGAISMTWDRDE